jgi:succinyl-diaminopimelate desuccinylase
MLSDIKELIAVRSVRGDAEPGKPYGPGPAAAMEKAAAIAARHGFEAKNVGGHMLEINLNDGEDELGILCHLDVVHEGSGWTTPPYEADVRDGRIYGRGAADNKGPAMAALYALKCVRELGVPLSKNVRLMLGTDEENGSNDLKAYTKLRALPNYCFSPDAAFPVYNIEKGRYATYFSSDFPDDGALPRLTALSAGHALNIVPDEAVATVEGLPHAGFGMDKLKEAVSAQGEKTGVSFSLEESGGALVLRAKGVGTHASYPDEGKNALTALLALLATLPLADSEGFSKIKALAALFPYGDNAGEALGVKMEDELSGPLTSNLAALEYSVGGLRGGFDLRCPICSNEENTSRVISAKMAEAGMRTETDEMVLPHHVPEDLPFIQVLMNVYESYTGLKGECVSMGGGTYVHGLKNCVAFGAAYPDTETYAHAADEYSVIAELEACVKIFAQSIIDVCS